VKQELTGAALNEFLLKRSGKTWDDAIEERATFADIDYAIYDSYLKISKEKGRLPDIEGLTTEEVFDKLRLTENGRLKRAAIILFGRDPGRFYTNTFVKIGRFVSDDADLRFQEVEDGNIIILLRNILSQLNQKFLVRPVTFEGMYRIEKDEYPIPALREMLLNALIHRNYMGAPTQIRVYEDKITIWNEGALPNDLSLELLRRPHPSRPRNPLIADVCFKGGLIDAWGRGTIKIIEACKQANLPEPELTEYAGGFLVTLFKNVNELIKLGLNPRQIAAVQYVKNKGKITNKEYQEINTVAKPTATRDLSELVEKHHVFINKGKGAGSYYEIIGS
jgi:ATP-dependent DNA helicase RecG